MKWTYITLNLSKIRKLFQSVGSIGNLFMVLSLSTFLMFILLGLGGYLQSRVMTASPVSSMKGLAASVSNQFFIDMLGLEVPHLKKAHSQFTFSKHNVFNFAYQLITDINHKDPKSLIASELPGMDIGKTTVLRSSQATNPSEPVDFNPPPGVVKSENSITLEPTP